MALVSHANSNAEKWSITSYLKLSGTPAKEWVRLAIEALSAASLNESHVHVPRKPLFGLQLTARAGSTLLVMFSR